MKHNTPRIPERIARYIATLKGTPPKRLVVPSKAQRRALCQEIEQLKHPTTGRLPSALPAGMRNKILSAIIYLEALGFDWLEIRSEILRLSHDDMRIFMKRIHKPPGKRKQPLQEEVDLVCLLDWPGDLSHDEIGEMCGFSSQTVKKYLKEDRARTLPPLREAGEQNGAVE